MTVAAVILAASPASALADADGTPAARRAADAAWAGGAMPVVVVAADPDGAIASSLATADATLLAPAPPERGPVGQIALGIAAAAELVSGTTAALVWPTRLAWADAETVTTLIEAHGETPSAVLRPVYGGEPGWPALVPIGAAGRLASVDAARMPDEILVDLEADGASVLLVDTGDPGVTHDVSVPRSALPRFDGPPRADDAVDREWGAPAADQPDDAPPAGPARLARPDPAS
jgi:hypothetical protein